ncbi:MAG: 3-phosphoshikimate 1-carboxyvinyltransferase [Chlamydiae bacterium]|nr:3-phosphoshikimate 1-carboxyvinyltransferase [Chlamydiota bacterium]MBI3266361.1 3-phosphoshikimate 1-carboxyvinyltransferase [Chlamydiota bacterium]
MQSPDIEIKPISKINCVIRAPGSKSYTNRALITAGLADGISYLSNYLQADDTDLMIKALEQLGIPIHLEGENLVVMGRTGRISPSKKRIFAGNSGTTFRFLTSLLTLGQGPYILDGDERMRERPIGDLLDALHRLKIECRSELKEEFPPIIIEAQGLKGGKTTLMGEKSSQYLSGLLMAAPYAQESLQIDIKGELVSKPYVDMTLSVMKTFGVEVERKDYRRFKIKAPQKYKPRYYSIEGDASNASYFFAAAALTGGKAKVTNLPYSSVQGDVHFVDILEQMGCRLEKGTDWIEITGAPLCGTEVDMKDMPDMVQTLAIVALFAQGKTVIRNIGHLKIKETDRLEALTTELRKMGGEVELKKNDLSISGSSKLNGASIKTYNDHRMAMSFAIAGLKIPGIIIQNPSCVNKSYPKFWGDFSRLEAHI